MSQETIDGYTIMRRIIQTASSEVFLAFDGRRREDVALKVVLSQYAKDKHILKNFAREAEVSEVLRHKNLVRVYDFVTDTARPYIVMRFIPGQTLKRAIYRETALVTKWGFHWIVRAAEGLGYMHKKGWVHLDVKPENLLVDEKGSGTIIDLALAQPAGPRGFMDSLRQKIKGQTFGTRSYMSPEQVMGKPPEPTSDVYSLGVTIFEMYARRLPLTASDPDAILQLHLKAKPPMLHHVTPDIHPDLSRLVDRMLEKDPSLRPPSMDAVIDALVKIGRPIVKRPGSEAKPSL